MRRLSDLHTDILRLISAQILHADLFAWRLTCKILAEVGDPFRFRLLKLQDAQLVRELCAVITTRPLYARHVQEIVACPRWVGKMKRVARIVEPRLSEGDSDWEEDSGYLLTSDRPEFRGSCEALASLLQHTATAVLKLELTYAEVALSRSPELEVAFIDCAQLTSLSLLEKGYVASDEEGLGAATIRLLQALRAPLRSLKLNRLLGIQTDTHLLDILVNFVHTLEELSVTLVYLGSYARSGAHPTFLRLHTAAFDSSALDLPTIEVAFPHLQELHVRDEGDEDAPYSPELVESNRAHGLATWKHLRFLSGHKDSLLGLGLSVYELSVGLFKYDNVLDGPDSGRDLAVILGGMRVDMLSLSASLRIDGLSAAISGMHEDTRILDLTVITQILSPNQMELPQLLDTISALLARHLRNLRYLRVRISGSRGSSFCAPGTDNDVRDEILRAFFNALPRLALFTLAGEHLNTTFLALAPTVLGTDVHAQRTFVIDDEVGHTLGSLKGRDLRDKLDDGPGIDELILQSTVRMKGLRG